MGYHLNWEEYQCNSDLMHNITEFRVPSQPSVTDIRSWFRVGLMSQVSPSLAAVLHTQSLL